MKITSAKIPHEPLFATQWIEPQSRYYLAFVLPIKEIYDSRDAWIIRIERGFKQVDGLRDYTYTYLGILPIS